MITAIPCVLVADDDPVSLAFLAAAIKQIGCMTIAAATGNEALSSFAARRPDLLLLDRCLPDMDAPALLALLRGLGCSAPAIATSAELDADTVAVLYAAGFLDTLPKPTTLEILHDLLHRYLGVRPISDSMAASGPAPHAILDDTSALAAIGGDRVALRALRELFAQELEALERDFDDDSTATGSRLHRLRASCGFCGASLLGNATAMLERALRSGDASPPKLVQEFQQACRATRQALAAD